MHHIMYGSPYKVRRRFLLSYLLPATLYPNQDSYIVLSVRLSVTPHTNSPPPQKKATASPRLPSCQIPHTKPSRLACTKYTLSLPSGVCIV